MRDPRYLVLDDGSVYPGKAFGAPAPSAHTLETTDLSEKGAGEVVFNTGMAGYHEIVTDPSYTGQIVSMTYPLVGNYGTDNDWSEIGPEPGKRSGIKVAGFAVRYIYNGPVPNGRITLDKFMKRHNTPGIYDIDTRDLTLRIRDGGSSNGVIVRPSSEGGSLSADEMKLCQAFLSSFPPMVGRNLISNVGTTEYSTINPEGTPHLLLLDCGIKSNIIRELVDLNCMISLLPSSATLKKILEIDPDAVLFSNGPGDPAVLGDITELIRGLIERKPVFGICLGHQLISQALGAKTGKMKFGHHGVNHPVRDERTGSVFVTSQNHGFVVEEDSLPKDVEVWFRNANDHTIEGILHKKFPIMTAQFHPEAAPGPHDSSWIFKEFLDALMFWKKE